MPGYEIRIVTRDGRTCTCHPTQQADVAGAIKFAVELKKKGEGAEVWDGLDCLYANYRDQPILAS
jgi:hypothetical protein